MYNTVDFFNLHFFWGGIIQYHKGGVGFKVFYLIILIRYLISPLLISITNGYRNPHMINVTASSNNLSVFIICSELIIACITISFFWKRCTKKLILKHENKKQYNIGFTAGGILLCFLLIVIITMRSNRFIPTMGILFLKDSTSDLGSFESIVVKCLKSLFFTLSLIWASKKIKLTKNPFYFSVVYFFSLINIIVYFGSNRSFVVETILSTIFLYLSVFPKQKKGVFLILIPLSFYIFIDLYIKKQFGAEVGNLAGIDISINQISNIIENYTNGIWPMASILDTSLVMRADISILTPIKDIVEAFFPFRIPGFLWIRELFTSVPSTNDIYMNYLYPWSRGAMITLSGQMWIYGGQIFGWIFALFGNIIMFYLLVRMEVLSHVVKDIKYKYMYIFMSVLLGLIMCYCAITIIWSWSQFILFYFILLKINDHIIAKKSVVHNQRSEKANFVI